MPTTALKMTVLHEQPPGFEPCPGKEIGVGDSVYDPVTGVHTITRFDDPPRYGAGTTVPAYRRAHDASTTWENRIFDEHTFLTRHASREQS